MKFVIHKSKVFKVVNGKWKYIGKVRGNWYITPRRGGNVEHHYFIKFSGFGLSSELIEVLKDNKITKVCFEYKGKRRINYRGKLIDFLDKDKVKDFVDESEGEKDLQFILDKKYLKENILGETAVISKRRVKRRGFFTAS